MSTFEDLFNKSVLAVLCPEASVGFPTQDDSSSWSSWLERVEAESADRRMAFFGKVHKSLLPILSKCDCHPDITDAALRQTRT